MGKEFVIRNVRAGDAKEIILNYYSLYDEYRGNPNIGIFLFNKKPSYKDEFKWFASLMKGIKSGSKIAVVAEVGGKVVGMCEASRESNGSDKLHIGSLGILIRKEYRGMGLGKAMMKDIIKKSRGKYEIMTLGVFANNMGAKALYRKIGFRKYGFLKNGIKRRGRYMDEEWMYLNLKK